MTVPAWIDSEENAKRSLRDRPQYPLDDRPVDHDHWHHWDYRLKPGRYEVSYVAHESAWWNYFAVGVVRHANQPEPINPADRFGQIANLDPEHAPVHFDVSAGVIVRIEAWVCVPKRGNKAPLPSGFAHWPVPLKQKTGKVIWHPFKNFVNNFQAVSQRTYTTEELRFGLEDGVDTDFNDLVVVLRRV